MNIFLKTQLNALQLEGYEVSRYINWWVRHPFVWKLVGKKALVKTTKIRLIWLIWWILWFSGLIMVLPISILVAVLFGVGVYVWPVPLLMIAVLMLWPVEWFERRRRTEKIKQIFSTRDDLKVIGITGSFGKTSTKDFLYQILNRHAYTLKTPASYNTDLGIFKAVSMELNSHHRYFICEMGAFKPGEIKRLVNIMKPDYAILTAIGSQHMERFGSIENIARAKFELIDRVSPKRAILNLDNPKIKESLESRNIQDQVKTFSLFDKAASFWIKEYKLTANGMEFEIVEGKKRVKLRTSLFGTSNLLNLMAAIGMARMLGVSWDTIEKGVASMKPASHRLELRKIGQATLIDNAYSSNKVGFEQIMRDLMEVSGKKALVTPGLVELGEKEGVVHKKMGLMASEIFDEIVLVGNSDRIRKMKDGIESSEDEVRVVVVEDDHESINRHVQRLGNKYDWVLLENDLTDTQS